MASAVAGLVVRLDQELAGLTGTVGGDADGAHAEERPNRVPARSAGGSTVSIAGMETTSYPQLCQLPALLGSS